MLTKKQYKFLKKVSKNDIPCGDLRQNNDKAYQYLLRKGFIEEYNVNLDGDIMERNLIYYCRVSEDGEVELKIYKQDNYRFWVPTILSIIAIIASFLAVFTQNEDLWKFLQELLQ